VSDPTIQPKQIIIIGAGPAGMMAAVRAAGLGQQVALIEKNASGGKKLLLSGKGRCNLTNAAGLEEMLERFSGHGAFLRDAFKTFDNRALMSFFRERGLPLKVERQQRVFPESDRSSSVLDVLKKELGRLKVEKFFNKTARSLLAHNGQARGVEFTDGSRLKADKVILATGGASYAFTGSDGSGIALAGKCGHTIVDIRPGLVPLVVKAGQVATLEGLTLHNIRLRWSCPGKHLDTEIGELLFTANGVSGPLVLTCSGVIVDWLRQVKEVVLHIDLKPGLSTEQVDSRLQRDFRTFARKSLKNALKELLPQRLIEVCIRVCAFDARVQCNQVTAAMRQKMVSFLKDFQLTVTGSLPLEEAMVTRGGVSLKEIDPRTMESRLIKGLYFAGEMIDIDADTGGFNLQAAFSTGYLAGESAARSA